MRHDACSRFNTVLLPSTVLITVKKEVVPWTPLLEAVAKTTAITGRSWHRRAVTVLPPPSQPELYTAAILAPIGHPRPSRIIVRQPLTTRLQAVRCPPPPADPSKGTCPPAPPEKELEAVAGAAHGETPEAFGKPTCSAESKATQNISYTTRQKTRDLIVIHGARLLLTSLPTRRKAQKARKLHYHGKMTTL